MQIQSSFRKTIQRTAWAAFLIFLPITSFPYFPPSIGGEALVRPLSLYPLIILVFIFTLPKLWTRPIPKAFIPLFLFALIAVISSVLSLLKGIEPALGVSVEIRVLRGLLTLAIGCAIYLTVALLPETINDLRFTLRWLYAGGILTLFWGSLQAIYILYYKPIWFDFLASLQQHISIRQLRIDRVAGMTYEPHWFADQIITLILPWVLASVLTGYTIFPWRWRRITIEWILLVWSLLLLPFTFSRAGLLNMVLLVFLAVLLLRPKKKTGRLMTNQQPVNTNLKSKPIRRFLESIFVLLIVIIPIYLIGARNMFFSRVWEYWQNPNATITGYMSYLGFDARLTYSQAAYNTFEEHPVLGVGLGNYAFYFEEMLPYRPIAEVPEALRMVTPEFGRDRLITSKNYYLRLLAETGILGAITFITFFIAHLGYVLCMTFSENEEMKYWGIACSCGLIAFLLSAFSFDSFVIPNMWVIFGLIAASTRVLIVNQASLKNTIAI